MSKRKKLKSSEGVTVLVLACVALAAEIYLLITAITRGGFFGLLTALLVLLLIAVASGAIAYTTPSLQKKPCNKFGIEELKGAVILTVFFGTLTWLFFPDSLEQQAEDKSKNIAYEKCISVPFAIQLLCRDNCNANALTKHQAKQCVKRCANDYFRQTRQCE